MFMMYENCATEARDFVLGVQSQPGYVRKIRLCTVHYNRRWIGKKVEVPINLCLSSTSSCPPRSAIPLKLFIESFAVVTSPPRPRSWLPLPCLDKNSSKFPITGNVTTFLQPREERRFGVYIFLLFRLAFSSQRILHLSFPLLPFDLLVLTTFILRGCLIFGFLRIVFV